MSEEIPGAFLKRTISDFGRRLRLEPYERLYDWIGYVEPIAWGKWSGTISVNVEPTEERGLKVVICAHLGKGWSLVNYFYNDGFRRELNGQIVELDLDPDEYMTFVGTGDVTDYSRGRVPATLFVVALYLILRWLW